MEHDLFNSVIDKDVASPHSRTTPPRQEANDDHRGVEPTPEPSNATPARQGRHPEIENPSTSDRGSVNSADTVRGVEVKRSPKRKNMVNEDDPMDDGELADSESDVDMEEPLENQIVSASFKFGWDTANFSPSVASDQTLGETGRGMAVSYKIDFLGLMNI